MVNTPTLIEVKPGWYMSQIWDSRSRQKILVAPANELEIATNESLRGNVLPLLSAKMLRGVSRLDELDLAFLSPDQCLRMAVDFVKIARMLGNELLIGWKENERAEMPFINILANFKSPTPSILEVEGGEFGEIPIIFCLNKRP